MPKRYYDEAFEGREIVSSGGSGVSRGGKKGTQWGKVCVLVVYLGI
jgi:hypothetical protein